MSIYSLDRTLRTTLLDNAQGEGPDQMIALHGIAVSREGDIYVGEVSVTAGPWFPRKNPKPFRTVVRLCKVKKPPSRWPTEKRAANSPQGCAHSSTDSASPKPAHAAALPGRRSRLCAVLRQRVGQTEVIEGERVFGSS
jgi:hypothetical protein